MTRLTLAIAAAMLTAGTVQSQIEFYENFDSDNAGVPMQDFTAFSRFTVEIGYVDLLGPGLDDFIPGSGLYVDMDGSSNNAGTLASTPINLEAGTYRLSYDLSYNPDQPGENNTMLVSLSGLGVVQHVGIAGLSPTRFTTKSALINVTQEGPRQILFIHAGGDNAGYLIDNVVLRNLACLADTNADGVLTPQDFTAWVVAFNANGPECEQNGDGVCSPADFSAWLAGWVAGCE
ncbi:MAG: hypothetical protein KDA31_02230 [Phycisphaerales bacterium]|nr:hypothetical protein [Phycisphaerales bacterium]MCB9835648.1 hypothetical protein [Phycisphaera sp.]